MQPIKLKILNTEYVSQHAKRFVVEKPQGFTYIPGQAALLSINLPGWENQKRTFTFTSLSDWPYLEFIIKIYNQREGVTHKLGSINAGNEFILHNITGTIRYKGPGIFLAGGTGITPFIAIFRALFYSNNLRQVGLIYSTDYADDVILHEELARMLGPAYMNVLTREGVVGFIEKRIDKKFLIENIRDFDSRFYVCGPEKFVTDINQSLVALGAKPESIIV
jgi:ferredoxin-NADP reductase